MYRPAWPCLFLLLPLLLAACGEDGDGDGSSDSNNGAECMTVLDLAPVGSYSCTYGLFNSNYPDEFQPGTACGLCNGNDDEGYFRIYYHGTDVMCVTEMRKFDALEAVDPANEPFSDRYAESCDAEGREQWDPPGLQR